MEDQTQSLKIQPKTREIRNFRFYLKSNGENVNPASRIMFPKLIEIGGLNLQESRILVENPTRMA